MKQNATSTLIDKHILKVLRNNRDHIRKQRNGTYEAFMLFDQYDTPDNDKLDEICSADDIDEAIMQYLHERYDPVADELQSDLVDEVAESIKKQLKPKIRKKLDKLVKWKPDISEWLSTTRDVPIVLSMEDSYKLGHCDKDKARVYGNNKSLICIVDQHGHVKEQLMYALITEDKEKLEQPGAEFLASCRAEVDSIKTLAGCVTFLVEMQLRDIFTLTGLINAANEDECDDNTDYGDIVLYGGVTTGLYDPWTGSYGNFGIKVDHDIVIPIKYITRTLPDSNAKYLLDMSSERWMPRLKAIRKPGEPKEERKW